jgi:hypothetical protein
MEEAVSLLAARAAKGPAKKRSSKKAKAPAEKKKSGNGASNGESKPKRAPRKRAPN